MLREIIEEIHCVKKQRNMLSLGIKRDTEFHGACLPTKAGFFAEKCWKSLLKKESSKFRM